jgi:hypothetical protein
MADLGNGRLVSPNYEDKIMTQNTDFLVNKTDFADVELATAELPALEEGQALLQIEKFALTANNITYAVVGDQMAYWNFFPAREGWGRVPVWGFATVLESRHPEITAGERVYGYLPMSTHLIVEPGNVSPGGFADLAAHRQPMSPIYNNYRRLAADPAHNPDFEDHRALFEPLFTTSFLIEAFMRKSDFFGASALLMTSASSKTSMALAQVAQENSPTIERIGLTSASNCEFVENLGLYDRVIAYEDLTSLDPSVATVSVDFAGNAKVLAAVHAHFGDQLKYSCLVGATHWEDRGLSDALPGPSPVLFFAPDHGMAMTKELGPEGFGQALGAAWASFLPRAKDWVTILASNGGADVSSAYQAQLSGEASPRHGIILSL